MAATIDITVYNVFLMNAECCAGNYSKALQDALQMGKYELVKCLKRKTGLLTLIIKRLNCIVDPNDDPCYSVEDIMHLMSLGKQLCKCDCCGDEVLVTYNEDTGYFTPLNRLRIGAH